MGVAWGSGGSSGWSDEPGHSVRRRGALNSRCRLPRGGDVAAREREHDLAADAGGRLLAAVAEDHDADSLLRDHADIGRGVVEAAVLVDDGEIVVAHDL